MGEGEAVDAGGNMRPVHELLSESGIEPIELQEKEGLALINGTDGMLGMLLLAIEDISLILNSVDVIAAMSVEACCTPCRVHQLLPPTPKTTIVCKTHTRFAVHRK
jgi:histidine ammonia-lyase